jgi:two-component system nitrogen regulation sensor histidine kinase NtrY
LRLQQNRLIAASDQIEERRAFTESVLSGVPVAVIGLDGDGRVNVINTSALKFLSLTMEQAIGEPLAVLIPELLVILAEAEASPQRAVQSQITLMRQGRERTLNVRLSTNHKGDIHYSVITLDDITDLVQAQRSSAWADVARRIAHEIRNPLTPIQLSAERLQRKYGRLIETDKEIFNQCTDTIIRQVDDIKRMVDEFSSFARMPKARVENDDIASCVQQVLFLMRVGNADVDIIEDNQLDVSTAVFDRRLLSQALTNVIKNAIEGIKASDEPISHPQVIVSLRHDQHDQIVIDVIDNGKGFPVEHRQRLLEPYMTTRSEGTGLGLPIVAKVLEDHGGGIELLDAPHPPGACVRLYFPRLGKSDSSTNDIATGRDDHIAQQGL